MYQNALNKLKKEFYTTQYTINAHDCFQLLSSVLPTNNLEYWATVKQIVLEHCVIVLKHYNLIEKNATYKYHYPNHDAKKGNINNSDALNSFLED